MARLDRSVPWSTTKKPKICRSLKQPIHRLEDFGRVETACARGVAQHFHVHLRRQSRTTFVSAFAIFGLGGQRSWDDRSRHEGVHGMRMASAIDEQGFAQNG